MAHDFGTGLWTFERVRALIERRYGVRFSECMSGACSGAVLAGKRKTWPALEESVLPSAD